MTKAVIGGSYGLTSYVSDGLFHSVPLTPPSAPTGLAVGTVTTTTVALNWTASSPNTYPVAGYSVYANGTLLGTTASTNYTATGLAQGTSYTFTVQAYDNQTPPNVGNLSAGVMGTTSAASAGSGTFTPAAGVTAALYGNTLSSSPVTGIQPSGSLLTIAASALPSVASNTALFYAELQNDLSTENVANGRSYDLSRTTQTLTGQVVSGSPYYPSGQPPSVGGPQIQATIAPTNAAGALIASPSAGATAASGYGFNQPTNFTAQTTGLNCQAYLFYKNYINYLPQNLKFMRGWAGSSIVGGSQPNLFMNFTSGQGLGGLGTTMDMDVSYIGGAHYFGIDPTTFPGKWMTREVAYQEGTLNNTDGIYNFWLNGYIASAAPWNVETQSTGNVAVAAGRIWTLDEVSVNSPSGSVTNPISATLNYRGLWAANTAYNVGDCVQTYLPVGTNRNYMTCTVAGTSAATGNGPNINYGSTVTDGGVTWGWQANANPTNLPSPSSPNPCTIGFQCLYFDDQPYQVLSSTESSFNNTALISANLSNAYVREIQPRYLCASGHWTVSPRRGSHLSPSTENVYSVNTLTGASTLLGTYTW